MTTRRRLLLSSALLAGVIVALVLGVFTVLPARPGVSKSNFDRIEVGMTVAEVTAILGEPG